MLTRSGYGCSTLAGVPTGQLNRLQSVMNSAARLVYSSRRSKQVSPLLQELHWLCVPEQIDFRLSVLVCRCINGTAPRYLASELQRVADIESRGRRRSSSTALLHVPRSLSQSINQFISRHSTEARATVRLCRIKEKCPETYLKCAQDHRRPCPPRYRC